MWRYASTNPGGICLLQEHTCAWRVAARRNIRTFSPVWLRRRNSEHRAFLSRSHVTSRYNSGTHGCNLPESCFTMSMNELPNPGSAAKLLVCQRSRAPKVVVARTVPNAKLGRRSALFFRRSALDRYVRVSQAAARHLQRSRAAPNRQRPPPRCGAAADGLPDTTRSGGPGGGGRRV